MRRLGCFGLMVVATRLLMGGGGSFVAPTPYPVTDGSWSRSGSNPILSPVLAWEETAVAEVAAVHSVGGAWKMWYSGGWANPGLGYATSSDGIAWTKDAGNPVLGQGGSGLAGPVASGRVYLDGSTYHVYFSSGSPLRSTMLHYTSSDGLTWSSASLSITLPSGTTLWGNREVWKSGATWYLLQEALGSPGIWRIYLYTGSDGNTWTIANGGAAYASLSVETSDLGAWGGPRFSTFGATLTPRWSDGLYHLFYHASAVAGNLPTDIYHATTTNLFADTWTVNGPVLTHTGSGFEVDQVAGAVPIVVGGTGYLFYDGDDNGASAAKIGVATAPASP